MARRESKKRKLNSSIAILVDGQTEKWYIEQVKRYYNPAKLRNVSVKPDLPSSKKVEQLFETAKEKLAKEYAKVLLVIDLDEIVKYPEELAVFKTYYTHYIAAINGCAPQDYQWMEKLKVIVNNPCLEYWYLLHFRKTTKYYPRYEPELKRDLQKCTEMKDYEKTHDYYTKRPEIYVRLADNLAVARINAQKFCTDECLEKGCSEMNQLFDWVDNDLKLDKELLDEQK